MKLLLLSLFTLTQSFDLSSYLEEYGYKDKNLISDNKTLTEALMKFQEYYGLPIDGTLNEETEKLMNTPRCQIADFNLVGTKWNKEILKWNFYMGNDTVINIAKRAFNEWEKVSGLTFEFSKNNPDILIQFANRATGYHSNNIKCQKGLCLTEFDGQPGGKIGHGFFPSSDGNCKEIHLDISEIWYFGDGELTSDKTDLYFVLLHEIGHTLGINHSNDPDAVMFAFYDGRVRQLHDEDILAVQALYAKPKSKSTTKPTSTSPSTSKPTSPTKSTPPDLCSIIPDNFLITSKNKMYVFYEKWVWIIDLITGQYSEARLLTDVLNFLPNDFSKISHIYQNSNGDVVIIINDELYIIQYPSLQIKSGFYKRSLDVIGIPKDYKKLNAIFNSYFGKSFVIYNDIFYVELDICLYRSQMHGMVQEKFPAIPLNITHSFRYRNGMIYFFKNDAFYEFDEFTNTLIRTGKYKHDLFGINCPTKNIFNQLKKMVNNLEKYIL